jgi:uncharacterized protein (DUF1800 family)
LVNSTTAERAWQTWFWFNHFNVFPQKSHVGAVLQSYVFGAIDGALDLRFADLLRAVTVHPAMLMYLDNVNNTKAKGNENLARELLELHTLGVSGGYSQQDVAAVAKVLSGWTVQLNGPVPEMGQSSLRCCWTIWPVTLQPASTLPVSCAFGGSTSRQKRPSKN